MRERFTDHGGVEIDTQGDAFFFAFARARDAVNAAVEAQRAHAEQEWPDGVAVLVRMGLHTGEPAVGSEGYLGLDVVRAARLCTAGSGGHVLLSETTRALVGSSLPEGVSVFPLGERRLKDIDEPERVFELEIEGAAQPQAPVRAAPPADDGDWGADLGARMAQRIEASVRRSVEASLERVALRRRRARGTGREAPRPGRRAARGRELAVPAEELPHPAQAGCGAATARGRSRAGSRAVAPEAPPQSATGRPAISSASSARETPSAPATCSGPATSGSASSSSASRQVGDLDRRADLVREPGTRPGGRELVLRRLGARRRRSATSGRSAPPDAQPRRGARPPPSTRP